MYCIWGKYGSFGKIHSGNYYTFKTHTYIYIYIYLFLNAYQLDWNQLKYNKILTYFMLAIQGTCSPSWLITNK